jgi:hypothetical protein
MRYERYERYVARRLEAHIDEGNEGDVLRIDNGDVSNDVSQGKY